MNSPLSLSSSSPSISFLSELEAILYAIFNGCKYGVKIRLPHAFVMTFLFRRDLSSLQKIKMICKLTLEHSRNLGTFAGIYKIILALLKYASRYGHNILRRQSSPPFSSNNKIKKGILHIIGRLLGIAFLVHHPYQQPSPSDAPPPPSPPGLPQSPIHSFLAGLIGGYTIWGNPTSINYQIVLYLLSRILMGSLSLAKEKLIIQKIAPSSYFKWIKSHTTFDNMYPLLAAGVWGIVMVLFEEYPHVLHPSLRRSMDEIYKVVKDVGGGERFPGLGQMLGGGNNVRGIDMNERAPLFTTGTSNIEFIEEE